MKSKLLSIPGLPAGSLKVDATSEIDRSLRPSRAPINGTPVRVAGEETLADGGPESGFAGFQFLLVLAALVATVVQDEVPAYSDANEYLPRILCPSLLVLAAWFLATLVRLIFKKAMHSTGSSAGDESRSVLPLPDSLPNVLFWIVFVLFLPMVLVSLRDEQIEELENSLFQLSPILLAGLVILALKEVDESGLNHM